jgi:hypothetical protein
MAIIIKFNHGRKEIWHVITLPGLSPDLNSRLSMQMKEFIHEIEDCELEPRSIGSVADIRYLKQCYSVA